jgi:DNA-binding response OmpR family regulator
VSCILIAERDHSVREVLVEATRDAFPGSEVEAVESGTALLEALERCQPTAAVLHWALAEEQGGECMQRLRQAQIPILLISAWDLRRAMAAAGPTEAALQKPFDLADYLRILRRLLRTEALPA